MNKKIGSTCEVRIINYESFFAWMPDVEKKYVEKRGGVILYRGSFELYK